MRDLCAVIRDGVNTVPKVSPESGPPADPSGSPTKQIHGDIRERRRLGKRILKAVQPLLETALQMETVVTSKSLEEMSKELDAMVEGSVEVLQPSITVSQEGEADTVMGEAPALQITVAGEEAAVDEDVMDTSEDRGGQGDAGSGDTGMENGAVSVPTPESQKINGKTEDAAETGSTPPATNGYLSMSKPTQATPPTPPQSTDSNHQADPLTEGGMPWYLKGFEVVGTSTADVQERGRSPSEELTDLDEVEMRELVDDVEKAGKGAVERVVRATRSSARRR